MKDLLKLIKLSGDLKLDMWRCRRLGEDTEEYRLANHYQDTLDHLETKQHNISALILETENLQNTYQDRSEIKALLTSVILLLNHLKSMKDI